MFQKTLEEKILEEKYHDTQNRTTHIPDRRDTESHKKEVFSRKIIIPAQSPLPILRSRRCSFDKKVLSLRLNYHLETT